MVDSADQQNLIAQQTGITQPGMSYTNCIEVLALRLCGGCGGLCVTYGRATALKQAFSARHGINHQPISPMTAYCCPETVFRQINRAPRPLPCLMCVVTKFEVLLTRPAPLPLPQGSIACGSDDRCASPTWSVSEASIAFGYHI